MSVSNLFHENDYDLFCNTLTVKNPDTQPLNTGRSIFNSALTFQPATQTITTYNVRGVSATLPPVIPIKYDIISANIVNGYGTCTLTIYQFTITGVSGSGAPQALHLPITLAAATPIADIDFSIPLLTSTGVFVTGLLVLGANGDIQLGKLDSSVFGAPNFGTIADIVITYSIKNPT